MKRLALFILVILVSIGLEKTFLYGDIISDPCLLDATENYCHFVPPIHISEKVVPNLEFIAKTIIIAPGQYQILYNSNFSSAPVPIQCFTRAHEYAHVVLKQLEQLIQNPSLNKELELEADRQAANWLIEQNQKCIVIYMANAYLQKAMAYEKTLPWYPSYLELHQNLQNFLNDTENSEPEIDPEYEVSFTIGINPILVGEFGAIVNIQIDGNDVGTISNFDTDLDMEVEISDLTKGSHTYKMQAKIYSFDQMLNPYYMKSIYGSGTIDVDEGNFFKVYGDLYSIRLRKN